MRPSPALLAHRRTTRQPDYRRVPEGLGLLGVKAGAHNSKGLRSEEIGDIEKLQ